MQYKYKTTHFIFTFEFSLIVILVKNRDAKIMETRYQNDEM